MGGAARVSSNWSHEDRELQRIVFNPILPRDRPPFMRAEIFGRHGGISIGDVAVDGRSTMGMEGKAFLLMCGFHGLGIGCAAPLDDVLPIGGGANRGHEEATGGDASPN